jgi:predicted dehydrogenase
MSEGRNVSARNDGEGRISRRKFVAGASAAALSFAVITPHLVRGDEANSKIDIGMIGCGQRGTWITRIFLAHGGYNVVAAADYFQDRVDEFGEKFKIDPTRRYTGLSCYRKMLEQKLDAVVIESPPYFHPEQAAAAVDAGRHVYLAKPIAVDVPGCQSIAESGKRAAAKRLCFLVDFQTRTHPLYQEAVKRVQQGDIGRIVCGEACYQAGSPWTRMEEALKADPTNAECRVRAWGLDKRLSGDVIVEQNIHALDVATWILDQQPIRAYGMGGRTVRTVGDCWDHFAVIFTFPNDILVSFCSKQFGKGYDDILCRMYGATGVIDTHYSGKVSVQGDVPYEGGETRNLYTEGAERNIADFYNNITEGQVSDDTVAASVRSNLTAILGRTAAYERREVTWDEMMKANERVDADLRGAKD